VSEPSALPFRRWRSLAYALIVTLAGCSALSTGSAERQADGTVLLRCRTSLPRCLERAEDACHGARYDVVRATDNRDYSGPQSSESEERSSEAVVRCGLRGRLLFGAPASKDVTPGPDVGPPPSAAVARTCVPGSTQTCVGPGACRGGQACLADGSGFGACACAPATAADAGAGETP
jgi:hypothetical protein